MSPIFLREDHIIKMLETEGINVELVQQAHHIKQQQKALVTNGKQNESGTNIKALDVSNSAVYDLSGTSQSKRRQQYFSKGFEL
jgi:hypothetical protein